MRLRFRYKKRQYVQWRNYFLDDNAIEAFLDLDIKYKNLIMITEICPRNLSEWQIEQSTGINEPEWHNHIDIVIRSENNEVSTYFPIFNATIIFLLL